jgi:hypothetical protein
MRCLHPSMANLSITQNWARLAFGRCLWGGGEEIQVLDHGSQGLWALTEQGIYFGEINSSFGPVLKFYRFSTRQVETFKEFPKDTKIYSGSTAFSVSPDGQWIIYTQFDQASSDLMLIENYR